MFRIIQKAHTEFYFTTVIIILIETATLQLHGNMVKVVG